MSTNRTALPSTAVMQVPGWLWGGAPPQYFAAAGLRCRPVPDRQDAWRVQTEERYQQVRPTLVTADHLAGPAVRRPRFDLLDVVARDALVDTEGGQLEREIAQRAQRAVRNGTFVDAIPLWALRTVDAPPSKLAGEVEQVHGEWWRLLGRACRKGVRSPTPGCTYCVEARRSCTAPR